MAPSVNPGTGNGFTLAAKRPPAGVASACKGVENEGTAAAVSLVKPWPVASWHKALKPPDDCETARLALTLLWLPACVSCPSMESFVEQELKLLWSPCWPSFMGFAALSGSMGTRDDLLGEFRAESQATVAFVLSMELS
jgi:hypothetical protein